MRIEPEQVSEIVVKLREWGVQVSAKMHQDLRDEFDTRSDIDENKFGKFSRKSEASRLAALRATPRTGTQRRAIYDFMRWQARVHNRGVTREELSDVLKISQNSVRPRVKELLEGGWIQVIGNVKNVRGETVEILFPKENS